MTPFVTEETSTFFPTYAMVFGAGLVSITTFLLLLEKTKLAVQEGDLRKSTGDVEAFKLRRAGGLAFDLAAVLRRMASCRFMEGEVVMAGGDFFVGEMTVVDEDAGRTKTDWDFG